MDEPRSMMWIVSDNQTEVEKPFNTPPTKPVAAAACPGTEGVVASGHCSGPSTS